MSCSKGTRTHSLQKNTRMANEDTVVHTYSRRFRGPSTHRSYASRYRGVFQIMQLEKSHIPKYSALPVKNV